MKSYNQEHTISVIVPVYGVEDYIERCARSLFEQSYSNMEFIFVNDCTKDSSMDILDQVLRDYPERQTQVKIVNQPQNRGLAAARIAGIEKATGEYLIHCDSDDWVEHTMYEKMLAEALKTEAEITVCNFVFEDKEKKTVYHYHPEITPKQYINFTTEKVMWSTWNRLCLTDFIRKNCLYPKEGMNMWEDLYVSVRANYFATKVAYVDEPLYHYDISRDSSLVHKKMQDNIIKQQVECIQLLDFFFRSVGFDASPFLHYRKCMIKSKYLQKSPVDYKGFQQCFPELTTYPTPCSSLYKMVWELMAKGHSFPYKALMWYYQLRSTNS